VKSQPDGRVAFDGEMRSAQHRETEQAAATPWARVAAAHGSLNVSRSSGGSTRGSSSSSALSLSLLSLRSLSLLWLLSRGGVTPGEPRRWQATAAANPTDAAAPTGREPLVNALQ